MRTGQVLSRAIVTTCALSETREKAARKGLDQRGKGSSQQAKRGRRQGKGEADAGTPDTSLANTDVPAYMHKKRGTLEQKHMISYLYILAKRCFTDQRRSCLMQVQLSPCTKTLCDQALCVQRNLDASLFDSSVA